MRIVVDVHTHMFSRRWLELLDERGGPDLEIRESVDSPLTLYQRGASFCVLEDAHFDYAARIRNMNAAGVDVAVITLPAPSVFWGDAETSSAAARLANDEFAQAAAKYPDRIRWMASLPWQYPELAIEELDRACRAGAVGVLTLGNIAGQSLIAPHFVPVWGAIDERRLPVLLHPTVPPGIDALDLNRYALVASTGFMVDTTVAVAKMIFDGFFDRFPNLKLIAAHAGATLPYLAGRFDRVFERTDRAKTHISRPPSEYLKHIYYDAVTYQKETLDLCISVAGAEHVLYGSDYPFNIGDMAGCLERVNRLPADQRGLVGGENARTIFGF
ncbi:MAG: amidohydrolase family protein [Gammaproteobacteria bacterium]|nr:amidohydrolase family protein [Gammaproteobacteria bacterium]